MTDKTELEVTAIIAACDEAGISRDAGLSWIADTDYKRVLHTLASILAARAPDPTRAVPADGLVEALAKRGFMQTEPHHVGEHRARKLVIGFHNPDDADLAMECIALAVRAFSRGAA